MGKLQSKFRRRSDLYRTTREEGTESIPVNQVMQYDPTHTDAINCVTTISPDLCVSGGGDQVVVVYDWRAGRLRQSLQGHRKEVTKVKCFPETSWIFSASRDKTVLMWDLSSGDEPLQEFCGHELVVNGLAISPDGSQMCTGSRDNSMCLWDIESGECLQRNTISRNLVTHVCWIPGSTSIAQTSEDKTVKIWDSRSWQVINTFPAKQYIQTHCDVSSNSNYLLSSSNGFGGHGCETTLWDLRQPGCKMVEYRGHLQTTACCIFLPCRQGAPAMVATSSHDCSVKIWDQNTAAEKRVTVSWTLCSLPVHADPARLRPARLARSLRHQQPPVRQLQHGPAPAPPEPRSCAGPPRGGQFLTAGPHPKTGGYPPPENPSIGHYSVRGPECMTRQDAKPRKAGG